jgi:predicted AAA+ superfamily ATPase
MIYPVWAGFDQIIVGLLGDGGDPRQIVFCPCEGLSTQDLRRIIKLTEDLTPGIAPEHRYWFFDEITYVSGWAAALKQLRDQTSLRSGCVVATGSSGAKLREAQGELGGREGAAGGARLLLPMGFRAFVGEIYPNLVANLSGDALALLDLQSAGARRYLEPLAVHVDQLVLAWERYVTIGGFPRAVADALEGVDVRATTANGLWNILVGDVLRVGSMSDRDVKVLLQRLVAGMGSPISVADIARSLNIGARNTVDDRIERLCASFYAWRASITHDGVAAVAGGQSKLYFTDPLIARLPSLRDRSVAHPDVTYLSEQQLGMCLLRVLARADPLAILDEAAILVQRNPNTGGEIDFAGPLVETPIESKYVSQKWMRERKALDEHYQRGIVATRDILDLSVDIWAIPTGLLAWTIDG